MFISISIGNCLIEKFTATRSVVSSSISIAIKCPVIQCGRRYRTFSPGKAKPSCIEVIKIWTTEEQLFQFVHWTATLSAMKACITSASQRHLFIFLHAPALLPTVFVSEFGRRFSAWGIFTQRYCPNRNGALISTFKVACHHTRQKEGKILQVFRS